MKYKCFCEGLCLLFLLTVAISSCSKHSTNPAHLFYYYGSDEKIYLTPEKDRLIVRFAETGSLDSLKAAIGRLDSIRYRAWVDTQTVVLTTTVPSVQQKLLNAFGKNALVTSVHPLYRTDGGAEVGLTDEFTVKFSDGISSSRIRELNARYHVTIKEKTSFYVMRVASKEDALKIANIYYETGLTEFSSPNFYTWMMLGNRSISVLVDSVKQGVL